MMDRAFMIQAKSSTLSLRKYLFSNLPILLVLQNNLLRPIMQLTPLSPGNGRHRIQLDGLSLLTPVLPLHTSNFTGSHSLAFAER